MAKPKSPNYVSGPHPDGGAQVKREGAERATRRTDTLKEARELGKELAQKSGGEHKQQGKDGKFIDSDSYGNDPNPPKDKKH